MAQSIFSLFGEVFVNTDKADESLHKTEEKAGGVGNALAKGIGTAAKWGTAIVGAATAVSGAAMGVASKAAESADQIDKMSQKIGISTDSYQEWSYIMGQNGMDIDKMQTGMKTLVTQMDKAAEGNKTAKEAFKALGIEVQNADGSLRSQEEVMNEAIMALANMGDTTERARLQSELFGKAGVEMSPMLNQGADAINGLKDRAHELGLVMSEDAIKNGVEFGDLMDDLKQSVSMLGTSLGAELFPIFNELIQEAIAMLPDIREMVSQLSPIIMDLIQQLLPPLMDLAKQLLPVISRLLTTLTPIIADLLATLTPLVVDIIEALMPLLEPILDALGQLLVQLIPPLTRIIQALMPVLEPILEVLVTLLEVLLPPLIDWINILSEVLSKTLSATFTALTPIIDDFQKILGGLIEFIKGVFTGDWERAWEGVTEIFGGIWDGLVDLAKAPLNAVITLFNDLFDEIGSIDIPDWVPDWLGGGTSLSLPHIPLLAKGGDIVVGGSAIVGEAGPELIDLPTGARVTPLTGGDLEQKLDAILKVISAYMPNLATSGDLKDVTVSVNERAFGRLVREVM